ncbi:MAG: hypothetical protein ACOYA8_00720 [Clostridium sp.]|jgi:hypothetical protein
MEDTKKDLQKLRQCCLRFSQLKNILEELYSQRDQLAKRTALLDQIRMKEQEDVELLEGRSLAAWLYGVLGKKEDRLDEERAEAFAAAVKYEASKEELDRIVEEIRRAEEEIRQLQGCEEAFTRKLQEVREQLEASGVPGDLLDAEQELSYIEKQLQEVNEAIWAGNDALREADKVCAFLDSAEGYSIWDIAGGGLFTTMMKHSRLDEANEQVKQLQSTLRRFKTELADVEIQADLQIETGGFMRFADYFFDGFFVDLAVQSQIRESLNQVQETQGRIKEALSRLRAFLSELEERKKGKETDREALLLEIEKTLRAGENHDKD